MLNSKDASLDGKQLASFGQRLYDETRGNVSKVSQAQASLDNSNLSLGMQGLETYFKSEQFHKDLSAGIVSGLLPYVNKVENLVTGMYDFMTGRRASNNSMSPTRAITRGAAR